MSSSANPKSLRNLARKIIQGEALFRTAFCLSFGGLETAAPVYIVAVAASLCETWESAWRNGDDAPYFLASGVTVIFTR
jgi:hypothetical protein